MHWFGYEWGPWAWVVMLLGMLIFWTAVIVGIIYLVRATGSSERSNPAQSNARSILDERFARGEISESECRAARDTLAHR